MIRSALLLLVAFCGLASAGAAQAQFIDWRFQSDYPYVLEYSLYSQNRPRYSWPGPGRVYVLADSREQTIRTSCMVGETICYGAWVRNRTRTYWGVGYNKTQGCTRCCYQCDGVQTGLIRFTL